MLDLRQLLLGDAELKQTVDLVRVTYVVRLRDENESDDFYPRSAEYWRLTQQGPGALLWASERCCQSVSELPLMDGSFFTGSIIVGKAATPSQCTWNS